MRKFFVSAAAIVAVATASPAWAERGDMLVKVRGSYALRSGSDSVTLKVSTTSVTAKADDAVGAEAAIDFFLTDNIAAEFAFGGASYDIQDAKGRTLASSGMITPTVTVLYYYPSPEARVRPYFGVGVSYVNFYSEEPGEIVTSQNPLPPVSYGVGMKSNIAPVGQIGVDVALDGKIYVNLDAKYVWAKSKLSFTQGSNTQTVDHDMKSFVIGAGVGFKF